MPAKSLPRFILSFLFLFFLPRIPLFFSLPLSIMISFFAAISVCVLLSHRGLYVPLFERPADVIELDGTVRSWVLIEVSMISGIEEVRLV